MSGGSCSADAAAGNALSSRAAVRILDAAALAAIAADWEALAAQALEPNPFYEHWMLLPALDAYSRGEASGIAVYLEDRLAGLFPFERLKTYRGLPVKALRSWRHRHCMLATPLVRAGSAVECLRALLRWTARQGIAAIEFDHVAADGPFQLALLDALEEERLPSLSLDGYARPLLRRAGDAQAYMARAISSQYRKQLRRLARRLEEHGRVEHVELAGGADAGAWLRQFMELEAAGWKGRKGSALGCRKGDWQFASEVFPQAHRRGRLIAIGLDVDGRPAARMCGVLAGEGAFYFKTAYDEALERFSPGILLELDLIARLHAVPGVQWMDSFTAPGNHLMKRLWKDARAIQRVAVGLTLAGRFAVTLLPFARFVKREAQAAFNTGAR